ncbi:Extracellular serine proteinase precursor [Micromonospora sp. MW-13]|uniref:S8 family peptidase n=1 Tax=Micromonospora sp. MW-13 TaxID=2094022 RepID=UPI000E4342A2|nr:S8 family peptidase [Micromonospora sp. MW-13]RGC68172.1 Extracellular serine proteinase precursor [Micromonospora sp. MW-13]
MRLRHRTIFTHTRRPGLAVMAVLATTTLAATMLAGPASSAPAAGPASGAIGEILGAGSATAVPGSYIVTLKESAVGSRSTVSSAVSGLAGRYGVHPDQVWGDALNGFSMRAPEAVARRLAADPAVAHVEQDRLTTLATTQLNAPWNLDRIDAPSGLSGTYSYVSQGTGVRAYIVDSGIYIGHQEFGGQAIYGYDAVDGMLPADDCNGHGTHTAGTVGGTTYGVAKDVVLVAVKVFDCALPSTLSILINGINWMVADHQAGQPAVANVGIQSTFNNALNTAVANAVADGITVTVPAGNSNTNACNFSPASAPTALTVAATQSNDSRASFSNYGPCVDIFAPGVSIMSAWISSTTAVQMFSGTSHAAPHVAGAAARVLSIYPTWTPAQVESFLFGVANPAVVNPGAGSPNRLLYLSPTF